MADTFIYVAKLDDTEILDRLDRIADAAEKMADAASDNLRQVGDEGKTSSLKLGAMVGVFAKLTEAALNFSAKAISAFIQIAKESVALNEELQTARITFTNIFKGNAEAADAFLQSLKEQANQLGINSTEAQRFAKAFLPDSASLDEFNELLSITTLAARDSGRSIDDLKFAISGAIVGQFESIRDVLDLPPEVTQNITKYRKEMSPVGAVVRGISEFMEKQGIPSIEDYADTFQGATRNMSAVFNDFKLALGEDIFRSINEGTAQIAEFITDNKEEIQIIGHLLGQLIARFTDLVGLNLGQVTEDLSLQTVIDFLNSAHEATIRIEGAVHLAGMLATQVYAAGESFGFFSTVLGAIFAPLVAIWEILSRTDEALETLNQVLVISSAGWAGIAASMNNASQEAQVFFGIIEESEKKIVDPQKAAEEQLLKGLEAYNQQKAAIDEHNQSLDEWIDNLHASNEAALEQADAVVQANYAQIEAAKRAQEYAEALEKVEEKIEESVIKTLRAREDALLDYEKNRLKILVERGEAELKLEQKNQERIDDINRKAGRKLEEALADVDDSTKEKIQDIADAREEREQQHGERMIEIRRGYLERIAEIERSFNQDAEDAIDARNTIQFLRLVKQRDRNIEEARRDRDTTIKTEQEKYTASEKAQDAKDQKELEKLDQKNQEKVAKIKRQTEIELEENKIKYDRELAQQEEKENEKLAKLEEKLAEKNSKIDLAETRRLEDLGRKNQEELEIIKEYEGIQTDTSVSAAEQRMEILVQLRQRTVDALNSIQPDPILPEGAQAQSANSDFFQNNLPNTPGLLPPTFLQHGGRFKKGEYSVVGEDGPELVRWGDDGHVDPNKYYQALLDAMPTIFDRNVPQPTFHLDTIAKNLGATAAQIGRGFPSIAPPSTINNTDMHEITIPMPNASNLTEQEWREIEIRVLSMLKQYIRGKKNV